VIRRVWRGAARFLKSVGLVSGLLAFIGVWSMAATLIPQGDVASRDVADWAASHPAVEPLVAALGLHQAFTAITFLACVFVLALSMAMCSWQRTKAATGRARTLRKARRADESSIIGDHDLEIVCDPALSASEVLSVVSGTLTHLGIKTKERDGVLAAVSSPLSVWGSPIFHWALLALMVVILVGSLQRSDGLMALTVGQTKVDAPASYGRLRTGPLHDWSAVHRSIRLDAFEPDFRAEGIDRGPTPTVSVLDEAGNVIQKQRIYPNMMLHAGSLSINAPAYGLSATLSIADTSGAEIARSVEIIDFSQAAPEGTVPVEPLKLSDGAGNILLLISVTVPLDRTGDRFAEWMPNAPTARVVVTSPTGESLSDSVVSPGQGVSLSDGVVLRLVDIGWYARLSLVDDWTTPVLYATMVIAMIGLAITLLFRQQLLLATVVEGPEGRRLVAKLRLWRNTPTSRSEITSELTTALGNDAKGGTS
jgi:cytochrome c biogenesis protein ResB